MNEQVQILAYINLPAGVSVSFIEGSPRDQIDLPPPCVDDYVSRDAQVRVFDAVAAPKTIAGADRLAFEVRFRDNRLRPVGDMERRLA